MSVLENVTLGPRKALGTARRQAEAEATELLARFGLADKRDEYPDRLSGGQQQRVAIVRALALKPDVMLLDEVTSALDPELVAEVLNVIRELAAGGMTMLIATHEMAFARDIASRVCFLDEGVILEQGPPAQIFSSARGAAHAPVPRPDHRSRSAVTSAAYTSIVLEKDTTTDVTLEPLDDWIVIEPLDDSETPSGLIVPINEGAQTRTGIVAAVGPDVETIEPGDKVLFPRDAGFEVRLARSAHRVRMLKREDLLARIHD